MPIDIVQHLQNENYSAGTQIKRVLWGVCRPLFRLSLGPFHGWRNFWLRRMGAQIGSRVRIHSSVRIMFPWNLRIGDDVIIGRDANLYALAAITIENSVLISHGAHLCAGSHDYRQTNFPIAHRPIVVGRGTWIATEAFVGPGVIIGTGAVIGARAVVTSNVDSNVVMAGNPARVIQHVLPQ
jgi:putative colanic acid biosynthesis acetyltransferase WcaF